MTELAPWLAFVAPLAPLLAALGLAWRCVGIERRPPADLLAADNEEAPSARLASGGALFALFCVLATDLAALLGEPAGTLVLGRWFGPATLSMTLDAPGLAFATVIGIVGAVTVRFSRYYLHREAGYHRFLMALSLFLSAMLIIALAGNAVLAFLGWELAGVSSYLLIGYAWQRPNACVNAQFAFVSNRFGDAGFIIAIALATLWAGDTGWAGMAAAPEQLSVRLITLGFVVAAVVKSAQLPFSSWIARALEGPTPSSAIFYGALMVHAGVFLLIRIEPLLVRVPDVMVVVAVVGLATTVYASLVAPTQTDVKSALVFSTLAQTGLMFVAIGLGWFTLAAWHLVLHAAWRAYQFLLAPSILELAGNGGAEPPAIAGAGWLHAAAMHRGWLDELAQTSVVRPLRAVADDARELEDRLLAPLAGAPAAGSVGANSGQDGDRPIIDSPGIVGHTLFAIAEHLQRFEARLLLRREKGGTPPLLHAAGQYLLTIERLLEQPRYLLVAVAITFVVIL